MLKNKAKKIAVFVVAFFVVLSVALTYITTGGFNTFSFIKSTSLVFSANEEMCFDREYIETNQTITIHEPNGVGTISHDYLLSLDCGQSKITSISLDFDGENSSIGNISLNVSSGDSTKTFEVSNTSIKDCSKLIMVGANYASEISITSRYDAFGGSSISNEEIVSLSSVRINDKEDIAILKKQLLFNLIKSVVFSVVILLIAIFIIKSKSDSVLFKNKFSIEKTFFIAAIIIGLVFSFLMPISQIPDEQTHINIIYDELNWDINIKTQSDTADFADTARIIRNYDEKVNLSTYFNFKTKAPLPSVLSVPSLKIIRHLPQAIGFVLTTFMRLPLWICLSVAEICALLVYAFFGYLAIKIIPFKKEIMTCIMLLPVCLQEIPSFSYDSFLLSSYFLLFAYILYVKFTKEKFTLLDVLIILSLTFVIAVTKIPYAAIFGLVLTIPIIKINFNFGLFKLEGNFIKKYKIVFSIATIICLGAAFVFAAKLLPYIGESETFLAALQAKRATIRIIWATTKAYLGQWLTQITGDLGWFDTPVSLAFTVFVVANLLFINLFDFNNTNQMCATKNPFKALEIIWFIIIAGAMFGVTVLSMFGWTMWAYGINVDEITVAQTAEYIKAIPVIGGLQGRYFVPIIPVILLPWYFPKVSKQLQKINHRTYLCGYHVFASIYLVIVLLNRYWI